MISRQQAPGSLQLELDFASVAASAERGPQFQHPEHSAAALQATARRLLLALGCQPLTDSVQVRWNPRMRSTAGTASYAHSRVTLNPRLREFGEDEIMRTLKHELAHLLAKFRAGRRRIEPHGAEWKRACRDLGLADESRCHNLPLPRRQIARKHIYRCPSCNLEIKRARPFRRRVACLDCCRKHNRGRYDEKFRLEKVRAVGSDPAESV
jgi:SprT protein